MLKPSLTVVLVGLLLTTPIAGQNLLPPPPPVSEQDVEAARLRREAARWRTAGNVALNIAIGSSVVALVFHDKVSDYPRIDRTLISASGGGLALWAIGGLISDRLNRKADSLVERACRSSRVPAAPRSAAPSPGRFSLRGKPTERHTCGFPQGAACSLRCHAAPTLSPAQAASCISSPAAHAASLHRAAEGRAGWLSPPDRLEAARRHRRTHPPSHRRPVSPCSRRR